MKNPAHKAKCISKWCLVLLLARWLPAGRARAARRQPKHQRPAKRPIKPGGRLCPGGRGKRMAHRQYRIDPGSGRKPGRGAKICRRAARTGKPDQSHSHLYRPAGGRDRRFAGGETAGNRSSRRPKTPASRLSWSTGGPMCRKTCMPPTSAPILSKKAAMRPG
jgi:hypothetical protein